MRAGRSDQQQNQPDRGCDAGRGEGEAHRQSYGRGDLEDADTTPQSCSEAESVADLDGLCGAGELGSA
jgi:hypothetical protein